MKHIVQFSGGIGSWAAGKRVAAEHGTEDLIGAAARVINECYKMRVTKAQMQRARRKLIRQAEVVQVDEKTKPQKSLTDRRSQCRPSGKYYISLIRFIHEGLWQDGGGI